jgi:aspartate/methionine/tyrosine aminotransferase
MGLATNPLLRRLGGYPLAAFQDMAREMRSQATPTHDFSIGDPVEPTPPFIRQALIDGITETSQYPTAAGLSQLREAIAGWVQRRFGVTVDPDREVLPTAGSKEAVFHLPLAIVDPHGDRRAVIWGDPGYQVYERGQLFAGGTSDPVALTSEAGWRLELGDLAPERLRQACIAWTNYPHNPTGATVAADYYGRAPLPLPASTRSSCAATSATSTSTRTAPSRRRCCRNAVTTGPGCWWRSRCPSGPA